VDHLQKGRKNYWEQLQKASEIQNNAHDLVYKYGTLEEITSKLDSLNSSEDDLKVPFIIKIIVFFTFILVLFGASFIGSVSWPTLGICYGISLLAAMLRLYIFFRREQ